MANKPANPKVTQVVFAVDRIEGSHAVLESEKGELITVSVKAFATPPHEGAVYRVPHDAKGKPNWAAALLDPAEEARRRDALGKRMARLRESDPGGDLKL